MAAIDFGAYQGVFAVFHQTAVRVYTKTVSGGYTRETIVGDSFEIMADIQPYNIRTESGGLSETLAGADYNSALWMYYPPDSAVETGMYAEYDGREYLISYIMKYGMGYRALLRCQP